MTASNRDERARRDPEAEATVRAERPSDAAGVREVILAAFGRPAEADLVERLRAAGALTVSLVAASDDGQGDGRIVGHVAASPVTIEGRDGGGRWLGLAPVAVSPDEQGRGVGGRLVRAALAQARRSGAELVVVLGEPGWYPRFGFAPADRLGLRCPWPVPPEAFMAAVPGGPTPLPSGLVRYHPAFDALEG